MHQMHGGFGGLRRLENSVQTHCSRFVEKPRRKVLPCGRAAPAMRRVQKSTCLNPRLRSSYESRVIRLGCAKRPYTILVDSDPDIVAVALAAVAGC